MSGDPDRLRDLLNEHLNEEELAALCVRLRVTYSHLRGDSKDERIQDLLFLLEKQSRLQDLVEQAAQARPDIDWVATPAPIEPPQVEKLAVSDSAPSHAPAPNPEQLAIYGDQVAGDKVSGDTVGGDKITVGNIEGSYAAIGAGAQVIVNHIQEALSAVKEMEEGIRVAERLLAAEIEKKLNRYTSRLTAPPQTAEWDNPYKALLDYKLEDAPSFYGRTAAIQAMLAKMADNKLTVLHSDSGSGKTSLLQAGLAARLLADGHFPLYLRPYQQRPDQYIRKEFLTDYATLPELQRFRDEQMSLRGFLERVTNYLAGRRLYIFLDQFEEFFTEQTAEARQLFAEQLQDCVVSDLPVWWVLALRKEYFSDLRLFRALKPFDSEYFLPTFRLEEAQEVITEPASLKGVSYEDGLVARILADIRQGNEGIPPAQVQLVCYTLFDELGQEANRQLISQNLYDRPRGRPPGEAGAKGILTSHLSRVLDRELSGQERQLAGRVLEALVTSDVRRVVRSKERLLAELEPVQPALLDSILTVLHESRLVRQEKDEHDQPLFELTHDYLLAEIDLDPKTKARKAAQELLAQELGVYCQFGTLLSKDRFDIINSQRAYLKLDELASELLSKSAAVIEAERQRELERERALADIQRKRAEEAEGAAVQLRRRRNVAFGLAAAAMVLAVLAGILFQNAENQRELAATSAAIAQIRAAEAQVALVTATVAQGEAQANAALAGTRAAEAVVAQGEAQANATLAAISVAEAVAAREEAEANEQLARARQLAAQAETAIERNDLKQAYLLAIQAVNLTYEGEGLLVTEAEMALYHALTELPFRGAFGNTVEVLSASFKPDGQQILLIGCNERDEVFCIAPTVQLWDREGNLVTPLEGHAFEILSASFSPDGQYILTNDSTARLWASDGKFITTLNRPRDLILSASFSPDGQLIVTAGCDRLLAGCSGLATLWDSSGTFITDLEGPVNGILSASFSGDGHIVTAGCYLEECFPDGAAALWDSSGTFISTFEGSTNNVLAASFSPDGQYIVTSECDDAESLCYAGMARVWNGEGNYITTLDEGDVTIFRSATFFNVDNGRILTIGDGTVQLWDREGNFITSLDGHASWILSASFSPDGQYIITTGDDNAVRLWDSIGNQIFAVEAHNANINSASFSPDSQNFVTTGCDVSDFFNCVASSTRLWDPTGSLITALEKDSIISTSFSPDAERIVIVGCDEFGTDIASCDAGEAWLWDSEGNFIIELEGHTSGINSATFSPDGQHIITASDDRTARVWDSEGNFITELEGHTSGVNSATFSPDGQHIVTASADRTARLWNNEGNFITELGEHIDAVNFATFSSDGQLIITASDDDTARLWDKDGNAVAILEGHREDVQLASFSLEGRRILTLDEGGTAHLWDEGGTLITILEDSVSSANFSPDGQHIITTSDDERARLWDAGGNPITYLEGHTAIVTFATFSPDGRRIVTVSNDETARLWDSEGNFITAFEGHEAPVNTISFSPDGTRLITASEDGTARLWEVFTDIDVMLAEAMRRLLPLLTEEECLSHFDVAVCESAP